MGCFGKEVMEGLSKLLSVLFMINYDFFSFSIIENYFEIYLMIVRYVNINIEWIFN